MNNNGHVQVCNDYRLLNWPSLSSYADDALVRIQFQDPNQRPVFLVINCVSNAPNYDQYELLVNEAGFGQTQFDKDIARWRAIIDSVYPPQPPPVLDIPSRLANGSVRFTLRGSRLKRYRVEASSNLFNWVALASNLMVNTNGLIIADTNAAALDHRFYRAAEE